MDENKKTASELNDQELEDVAGGFGMMSIAWHSAYPVCPDCQQEFLVQAPGFNKRTASYKCPYCGSNVVYYG